MQGLRLSAPPTAQLSACPSPGPTEPFPKLQDYFSFRNEFCGDLADHAPEANPNSPMHPIGTGTLDGKQFSVPPEGRDLLLTAVD
jgi:hypothetical protein